MKFLRYILLFFICTAFAPAVMASEQKDEPVDVKEIVLGHMSDAYEWHITTWNGHHVSIPLPVIVKGEESGWHVFSSARFHHAPDGIYEGFYLNEEANGKIYELLPNGTTVRPWDFSITKNVVQIWITAALMLIIFIGSARWYRSRKSDSAAPKGFVGLIEMFVMTVNDDLIKPSVGEKHYKRFAPYLLTAFFFIFINNLMGIVPFFPGGANTTGNIAVTLVLAICTFLAVNLFGNKHYWKEIFWPDVPIWLKCPLPIMQAIEVFGVFTKPAALCVRLFANMMGGHMIVIVLTLLIFIFAKFGPAVTGGITVFSVLFSLFMLLLDTLVSFIQAFVFTMLSTLFISMAVCDPHEGHGEAEA